MRFLDDFLNGITMYRLVFYYLISLVLAAAALSFLGLLPFSPLSILISAAFLVVICVTTNKILAYIFKAPANIESSYITALILCLIITPASKPNDFVFLLAAGVIAMAGKYILFWKKKHIFNPAAAAVTVTAFTIGGYASWWVGTTYMLPFLLLGVLIVRKIKRTEQVFAFFVGTIAASIIVSQVSGNDSVLVLKNTIIDSPILFFAFIMFTEPLTSPTMRKMQIVYGAMVGVLYSSQLQFSGYYMTPELALLCGNLFAYIVGMKTRMVLALKEKTKIGSDIFNFSFPRPSNFSFTPGQYMEWTLAHRQVDTRGDRRFFTIAASPTEGTIRLGVRFSQNGSSFKRALSGLTNSQTIVAGQLGGDFILSKDSSKKLVFIAGGIGITPFRSIIKYLIDKNEKRDIVLFYANKTADEIVYKDVFDEAEKKFGLKTIYVLEHMNSETIKREVPDFLDRTFYLSGPHAMVDAYKKILNEIGVCSSQIMTDYFPGY